MDAHETSIFTAILIASLVLAIIIGYFFVTLIRNQRRTAQLYKEKILAEITTLERERARIATDLHDELGPYLSVTKFRINALDVLTDEDKEHLVKINENIDLIIHRMREIAADLMPMTLLRKGLTYGIREFIDNISKPSGLQISFNIEGNDEFSSTMRIHLYRIIQEIVHNTVKHAQATSLKIDLKQENRKVLLITEDNGTGFDYNSLLREKQGVGLRSMLSRVEVMGGEMFIESGQKKGTRYTFEIPVISS